MTDVLTPPSTRVIDALAANIADGIYPEMTEEVYRPLPFANASMLKIMHEKSAKHVWWARHHPKPPTPALTFGNAFHCYVLRPDDFKTEWRVSEPCHCGNNGKRIKDGQWVCGTHGRSLPDEKDYITSSDMNSILAMSESYLSHKGCRHYLREIDILHRESVAIWTDPETGVRCKAKIDLLGIDQGMYVVPDLKSCEDASEEGFGKSVANYFYAIQAAFYLDGLSILLGGELLENFQFLAIEKEAPYACAPWKLHQRNIALGRAMYRSALAKWKACTELDRWPGYAGGLCNTPKYYFMNESKKV